MTRILALWSAPRSRSTAFLRMMVERGDHQVLHEPFAGLADFGTTTVGDAEPRTEGELIAAIRALAANGPVFFKDTTDFRYPGLLADTDFLRDAVHTFLLRDPAEVIASHYAMNARVTCEDIGIARLCEIHDAVAEATGEPPVVVHAEDLVARPAETVRAYCSAVGIPFVSSALSWDPGVLPEWRRTERWHRAASRSSGFTAARVSYRDTVANNPTLAAYLDHHRPFYERLSRHAISVPA